MPTTLSDTELLAKLQSGFDVVSKNPRPINLDDHLVDDLELDSLDFIDLVSALEEEFPPETVDAIVDRATDLRTVRDLIEAFRSVA